jgi:hypothetical protein
MLQRFVELLADAVGLRVASLGQTMIDIVQSQVELILVVLTGPVILRAPICEHAQQRYVMLFSERQDLGVEKFGCH